MHSPPPVGTAAPTVETLSGPSQRRLAARAERRARQFLKGPVPMTWLERAAALPGKAFQVAILLRFMDGLAGGNPFPVSSGLLGRFHVGRKAAYRAVAALEAAGLIQSERGRGRLARVSVLVGQANEG